MWDLRAGFNRLSMYVRERTKANLLDGDLYLFMGKNRKKLKAICFDGTGLLLIAKRLGSGPFMSLEKLEEFEISADELDSLLRGSIIKRTHFGDSALTRGINSQMTEANEMRGEHSGHRDTEAIHNLS